MRERKVKDRDSYFSKDISDKIILNMRDINYVMRYLYEGKASQKRILIILNEVQHITQRELTKWLGIQPGSASEVIAKLEHAGLILRKASETDRRTTDIVLTNEGRQQALEAVRQRNLRHKEMFSCLSDDEKLTLLVLLEKINADWEHRYWDAGEQHNREHR